MEVSILITLTIITAVAVVLGFVVKVWYADRRIAAAVKQVADVKESAEREAESIKKEKLVEAKDEIFNLRSTLEREGQERRRELDKLEQRLSKGEDRLLAQEQNLARGQKEYDQRLRVPHLL